MNFKLTSLLLLFALAVLLFGIVLAYFVVRDLDSPWLMFGAAAAGLLAVVLVETLEKSGRVKADAALGLVFAALFAAGVLMVSVSVKNVHLDVDQVLLGQPESADQPRWEARVLYQLAVS